jgi:hypothetical protein
MKGLGGFVKLFGVARWFTLVAGFAGGLEGQRNTVQVVGEIASSLLASGFFGLLHHCRNFAERVVFSPINR